MRRNGINGSPIFACSVHALRGDEPITDEAIFRLVSVTMEVRLCGAGESPGMAHAEALSRLEEAIAAAGGVINLHACRSLLARAEPQPARGPQPPGRGREA
jgi:hypothetical protein